MKKAIAGITVAVLLSSLQVAHADTFTGTIVNRQGVGIPGIDIDALDANGDPVTLFNDGTDINGFFNVTVLVPGVYTIIFNAPPPPPTYAILVLPNVNVVGIVDLGVLTMKDGAAVSGRVVTTAGIPVEGVNLDAIDSAGNNLWISGDRTDLDGRFTITVPTGKTELRFDPAGASIQVLAPFKVDKYLGQSKDIGVITLAAGMMVTGVIRDPALGAVIGADLDAIDSLTGDKLYTPGDNTDNNGFVDFIVPAGTYDFKICPQFADGLATARLLNVPVIADTSLGLVILENGVILSGTVRSVSGTGLFGVDLDLRDQITQLSVPICDDNTDSVGNYAVVVPTGTFDLIFTPKFSIPFSSTRVNGVTVAANTVIDAVLADCDCLTAQGQGIPGTGGLLPKLISSGGCLRIGNPDLRLKVRNALGGAFALITAGVSYDTGATPFGGSQHPFGSIDRVFTKRTPIVLKGVVGLAGDGSGGVSAAIPADPAIVGLDIVARAVVRDPQALGGLAVTRPLVGTACD